MCVCVCVYVLYRYNNVSAFEIKDKFWYKQQSIPTFYGYCDASHIKIGENEILMFLVFEIENKILSKNRLSQNI